METILHYKGAVDYETVNSQIRHLQEELGKRNFPLTLYKRILVVMIELLENIYKYCDPLCLGQYAEENYPEITIEQTEDHFLIKASNPLMSQHIDKLKAKLDFLKSLDRTGLMESYKKTITNGQFTEKGGAGLGLLEIAKISALPLNYSFDKIDATHTIYSIQVAIDK